MTLAKPLAVRLGSRTSASRRFDSVSGWLVAFVLAATFVPAVQAQEMPPAIAQERAAMLQLLEGKLDSSDAAERAAVLGMVLQAGLRLPEARVERLLRDPSPDIRKGMALYPFLSPSQLVSVAATADATALQSLLYGRKEPVPRAVVQALLARRDPAIDRSVAGAAEVPLAPADVAVLAGRRDALVDFLMAQSRGIGSVDRTLRVLIGAGSADAIDEAIQRLPEVPSDVVDTLLAQAPLAVRRYLLMQGRFKPTAAQAARVLADPDPEVRIGLLRRRDLPLPAQAVADGLFDADENVAFWFHQRQEFAPTPAQVEAALTSPRPLLRRGFIGDDRVPLTAAQVERGLGDPDANARSLLIHRKSVRLNDAQLDRCLADADFQVRDGCAQRAEFRMTQPRFERLVLDANPNLLGLFTDVRRPNALDLSPFVTTALQSGSAAVRLAMARHRRLVFDEAQIQLGLQADEADVRAAFQAVQRRPRPRDR